AHDLLPGSRSGSEREVVSSVGAPGARKLATARPRVARQYLGSVGKVDTGIVAVTSLWADERLYFPLHVEPYEPAARLPKGKQDPAFRTKPQIGMALVEAARALGLPFRAVIADCTYGESAACEGALREAGLPYVVALKPSKDRGAAEGEFRTLKAAAQARRWNGPDDPQGRPPAGRRFRDRTSGLRTWRSLVTQRTEHG